MPTLQAQNDMCSSSSAAANDDDDDDDDGGSLEQRLAQKAIELQVVIRVDFEGRLEDHLPESSFIQTLPNRKNSKAFNVNSENCASNNWRWFTLFLLLSEYFWISVLILDH